MQIHPLPTPLHSLLVESGVEAFELNFDRRLGYLDVSIYIPHLSAPRAKLAKSIELWADVYQYDFDVSDENGDTIVYDLVNGKVEHKEWYMQRCYEETVYTDLKLES